MWRFLRRDCWVGGISAGVSADYSLGALTRGANIGGWSEVGKGFLMRNGGVGVGRIEFGAEWHGRAML